MDRNYKQVAASRKRIVVVVAFQGGRGSQLDTTQRAGRGLAVAVVFWATVDRSADYLRSVSIELGVAVVLRGDRGSQPRRLRPVRRTHRRWRLSSGAAVDHNTLSSAST
ncbi:MULTISPECIES: hypothetical protein [unclassified Streptomyces]|uniref:hypothetical protein n=1 Tax=unclassified Streptomyces TaxID=2593676 RepID=UPI00131A04FB|nr:MULTISPECIES: hypothetical protein [unclassified Streptomyces]MYT29232.1 hypothetical protein [Streptomyces sp. SID8354]